MGRPKTTGRFKTRQELLDRIWFLYKRNGMSMNSIAHHCKVSNTTVAHVIDAGEPDPLETLQAEEKRAAAAKKWAEVEARRKEKRAEAEARRKPHPKKKKPKPEPERDRPLTEAEMEAIDRMTENARDVLGHCGHGWTPDECRVHLPAREFDDVWNKHELDAAQYFRPTPSMKERAFSMVRVWMDWNLNP